MEDRERLTPFGMTSEDQMAKFEEFVFYAELAGNMVSHTEILVALTIFMCISNKLILPKLKARKMLHLLQNLPKTFSTHSSV